MTSAEPDTSSITLFDIGAALRDELNLPRLCHRHAHAEASTHYYRRGVVAVVEYTCGCHYDAAQGMFRE